jgi:5-methylcytosine-specific restriction endonuclease McrA
MDKVEKEATTVIEEKDERDYYNDPSRRLVILARDTSICAYCTATVSEDTFALDHLLPVARGGTNKKHNLLTTCEVCNRRRGESEPVQFLRDNYRKQLITQDEFLRQKEYIEALLADSTGC